MSKGARTAAWAAAVIVFCSAASAQDTAEGERQFQRNCGVCHVVSEDGPARAGPNLHGIVGRPAASQDGFPYSAAMSASGLVWDAATLDAYITNSQALVPGANMSVRVRDEAQRAAIIDYLETAGQ